MGRSNIEPVVVSRRPAIHSPTKASISPRGAARQPSTPFLFVTSANAKPDAASRRSIRSHVMRGKNRKRPSDKPGVRLGSWINSGAATGTTVLVPGAEPSHVPRSMGSDLTCLSFAEELTSPMRDLVFQCTSRSIIQCPSFNSNQCPIPGSLIPDDSLYCHQADRVSSRDLFRL